MTMMQYAIARVARQHAESITRGETFTKADRSNAVAVYDALARYVGRMTPGEYAAEQFAIFPLQQAVSTVAKWREQT